MSHPLITTGQLGSLLAAWHLFPNVCTFPLLSCFKANYIFIILYYISARSKHWCQTNLDYRKIRNGGHAGGLAYSVVVIHSVTETEKNNISTHIRFRCTPAQEEQTISDLTNMIWPSVPAGDTPQDSRSGHANPVIAYSWDIILLNCFLSQTRCGLSQFCWNSPTVLFWAAHTSQCSSPPWNWQVTAASPRYQGGVEDGVKTNLAAGTGRYERLWGIWNDSGPAELRRKKAAIAKTRVCSSGNLRVCPVSLWMWVWNEYWCQCTRSHDGCV